MITAVTGAAGFIGSNMVKYLQTMGHKVRAIDCVAPTDPFRLEAWHSADEVRIENLRISADSLAGSDYVFNFAADMGGCEYIYAHDFDPYVHNSRITFNVFQAIHEHRISRAFFPSSACIYPIELQAQRGPAPKLNEACIEQGQPDHMYGREKLMMLRLAERFDGDARVGIFHTIYGIGQERSGNRMKFPASAVMKTLSARETGEIECWGDGSQLRSYLYIDDALEKIYRILFGNEYSGPVNVGYSGAISCVDVLKLCCSIVGIEPRIVYTAGGPAGIQSRDCDNTKWVTTFGPMPLVDYREGFRRTIEWADR